MYRTYRQSKAQLKTSPWNQKIWWIKGLPISDYEIPSLNPGPEVIKPFPCSTQLSMKFKMLISLNISRNSVFFLAQISLECYFLLRNVKMPTTVGILTIMDRKNFMLNWAEHEKSFITLGPGYGAEGHGFDWNPSWIKWGLENCPCQPSSKWNFLMRQHEEGYVPTFICCA